MSQTNIHYLSSNPRKYRYSLPFPQEIKQLRLMKGFTQTELAKRSGFSQSLIARIENGKVDPRLSTLRKILSTLYTRTETASDISTKDVITLIEDDTVGNAIEVMKSNGISQIPVRNKKTSKILGGVTEKIIMTHITKRGFEGLNDKIGLLELKAFEYVEPDLQLPEIEKKLLVNSAVLVKLNKTLGIITKSDLLQYYKE